MREGLKSLAKVRTYCYIVFFLYVAFIFHDSISGAIGFSDKRLSLGIVAIVVIQLLMCILYDVKFATTVPKGKTHKIIMMYCAQLRLWLLIQIVVMIAAVVNIGYLGNYYLDKILAAVLIILLLMTLKSLTVIQRGNFVLPEQSQGGRSQGNRKNGSGKKKKKK